jgi:hypothetical protein
VTEKTLEEFETFIEKEAKRIEEMWVEVVVEGDKEKVQEVGKYLNVLRGCSVLLKHWKIRGEAWEELHDEEDEVGHVIT